MRVWVTGSRDWPNPTTVTGALERIYDMSTPVRKATGAPFIVVEGGCPTGADFTARTWAAMNDGVALETVEADWDHCGEGCPPWPHRVVKKPHDRHHPGAEPDYCPVAGPRRNAKVAAALDPSTDVVLACQYNGSSGTGGAIKLAHESGFWEGVNLLVWVIPGTGGLRKFLAGQLADAR